MKRVCWQSSWGHVEGRRKEVLSLQQKGVAKQQEVGEEKQERVILFFYKRAEEVECNWEASEGRGGQEDRGSKEGAPSEESNGWQRGKQTKEASKLRQIR